MSRKKHQTYEGLGKKSQEKFTAKKGLSKKKKEQKDFQKVKLKAGKLRPKGLNETKLEFQSKSIVIREQLRQELGPERIQVTSPSPAVIFVSFCSLRTSSFACDVVHRLTNSPFSTH